MHALHRSVRLGLAQEKEGEEGNEREHDGVFDQRRIQCRSQRVVAMQISRDFFFVSDTFRVMSSSSEELYWSPSPPTSKKQKTSHPAPLQFSSSSTRNASASPSKPAPTSAFTTPSKSNQKPTTTAGLPTPSSPALAESLPAKLDSCFKELREAAATQERQLRAKRQESDTLRKLLKDAKAKIVLLEARVQYVVSLIVRSFEADTLFLTEYSKQRIRSCRSRNDLPHPYRLCTASVLFVIAIAPFLLFSTKCKAKRDSNKNSSMKLQST